MNRYREHVAGALEAVRILSPTRFSWFGQPSPAVAASVQRALTPEAARDYLLYALQNKLYDDFYCRGAATPTPTVPPPPPVAAARNTPFVAALSAANTGQGHWAEGWTVREVQGDRILIARGSLTVTANRRDLRSAGEGPLAPGEPVQVRHPKELRRASPGFYLAAGDHELRSASLVRIYWNITPEGAAPLMGLLTRSFNQAGVPFHLKALNDPAHFTRCDAAVLYLRGDDFPRVTELLLPAVEAMAPHLKPQTPAFTKVLAPGVGLAEDPGQHTSFGLHRSRLLAEALVAAADRGRLSPEERLAAVEAQFAREGLSLDRPYLNPGAPDRYDLPLPGAAAAISFPSDAPSHAGRADRDAFLDTAQRLGKRLAGSAVWHDGRCNWVGPHHEPNTKRLTPLGADLYDGTAGVAWFLAELHSQTGDEIFRKTALGAIGHALRRTETVPSPNPLSLFFGEVGTALAAGRVGTLLEAEDVLRGARNLLPDSPVGDEYDVMSGHAGSIMALLALARIWGDGSLTKRAIALGARLLQTAAQEKTGLSWRTPGLPTMRNLTGLAHGAAGAGLALVELFALTGEERFRRGAEGAFAYERRWYDPALRNWPDFRGERHHRAPVLCETHWCHGSAGIALSRLRAAQLLDDTTLRAEALIALETTAEATRKALASRQADFSLCHGLAGNAEILGIQEQHASLPLEIAQRGMALHGDGPWPCGGGSGETPGLMLGLAGIGRFYLRLACPELPSILWLHPEQFTAP